jgi:hypothetical protein
MVVCDRAAHSGTQREFISNSPALISPSVLGESAVIRRDVGMTLYNAMGLNVLQDGGGHDVVFFVLRCVIAVLAFWVLWKLCTALFSTRQSRGHRLEKPRHDEWAEVLEQIANLLETTDPHSRAAAWRRPPRS